MPEELGPDAARHVLGAQANVWTEYIDTPEQVEYMVFPRMFALSEVVWTDPEPRHFGDFARRLPWHLERLDAQGIRYRIPDVLGLDRDRLTLDDDMKVTLGAASDGSIHYTVDGTEPSASSPRYTGPVKVKVEDGPVEVAARMVLPDGREGPVRKAAFSRATPRPAALVGAALEDGLNMDVYRGRIRRVADVEGRGELLRRDKVDDVALPAMAPDSVFGLRFGGYLSVPEDGVYTFRLTADDGAVLRFGGAVVLDNDGPHGPVSKTAEVALAKGLHPFEVVYFQAGGGKTLKLETLAEDGVFVPLPKGSVLRVR